MSRSVATARRPHGDPYAGIPGRRVFVAAPLPATVCAAVERVVADVRGVAVPGDREVRWVRLDGLHLTLRFLGPTPEARIEDVLAAMQAAAAGAEPFEASLDGAGAFPGVDRPRTLWLGIGRGAAELGGLAAALDRELAARGWPGDDRPFRAHLTLARSDGVAAGSRTAARLIAGAEDLAARWTVDRVVLFESVTGGGPARYVPLGAVGLGRREA